MDYPVCGRHRSSHRLIARMMGTVTASDSVERSSADVDSAAIDLLELHLGTESENKRALPCTNGARLERGSDRQ